MNNRLKPFYFSLAAALTLGLAACAPAEKDGNKKDDAAQSEGNISEDPLNKVQQIVETSSQSRFRAVKIFDVSGVKGVRGVIAKQSDGQGQPMLGWTNASGDFFIPGPMFDKNGKDVSKELLQKYGGMPSPKDVADQAQKVGFVAGDKGPIVTAFFEPYCGYCNKLFQELEPKIAAGEVRVRFIMVGFLAEDSLARAADIVNAADPYAALVKWENSKDKKSVKASTASEEQKSAIASNNMLMNKAGQSGTPALLYCNKSGEVQLESGMPQDINSFLSNVGTEGHAFCSSK